MRVNQDAVGQDVFKTDADASAVALQGKRRAWRGLAGGPVQESDGDSRVGLQHHRVVAKSVLLCAHERQSHPDTVSVNGC